MGKLRRFFGGTVVVLASIVALASTWQHGWSFTRCRQHQHTAVSVQGMSSVAFNVTLQGLPFQVLQGANAMRAINQGVEDAFVDHLQGCLVSALAFPGDTPDDTVVQVTVMPEDGTTDIKWDDFLQLAVARQVSDTANKLSVVLGGRASRVSNMTIQEQVVGTKEAGTDLKPRDNISLGEDAQWQEVTVGTADDDRVVVAQGSGDNRTIVAVSPQSKRRSDDGKEGINTSSVSGASAKPQNPTENIIGTMIVTTTHATLAATAVTESTAVATAARKKKKKAMVAVRTMTTVATTVQSSTTADAHARTKMTTTAVPKKAQSNSTHAQAAKVTTTIVATTDSQSATTIAQAQKPSATMASTEKMESRKSSEMTVSTVPTAWKNSPNDVIINKSMTMTRVVVLEKLPADVLIARPALAGQVEAAAQDSYSSVLGVQSSHVFASIESSPQRAARRLVVSEPDVLSRRLSAAFEDASSAMREVALLLATASQGESMGDQTLVNVEVAPNFGQRLAELEERADLQKEELKETLLFSVEGIEGIQDVTIGTISVSIYKPGETGKSTDLFALWGPVFGICILALTAILGICGRCCCCLRAEACEAKQPIKAFEAELLDAPVHREESEEQEELEEVDLERDKILLKVFRVHDRDADGSLSEQELLFFAQRLGFPGSSAEFHQEFEEVCKSHGGILGRGLELASFRRLVSVQPPDDAGWYCTVEQLEELSLAPSKGRADSAARQVMPRLIDAPLPGGPAERKKSADWSEGHALQQDAPRFEEPLPGSRDEPVAVAIAVPVADEDWIPPQAEQEQPAPSPASRDRLVEAVFDLFDADRDQLLNVAELQRFAESLVEKPFDGTAEEWNDLYDEFIMQQSGMAVVNLELFTSLLNNDDEANPFYQRSDELELMLSRSRNSMVNDRRV